MKINISPELLQQYLLAFIVNLSMIPTGMSLTWPSPVLVKLANPEESPLSRIITADEGSWIVATGFIFTTITNILGGMLMDTIGRKYCLLLASIQKIAMGILLINATEVWMVILGRALMIVADCYTFIIVPIYASEIACKEQRDALGSFLQIFTCMGTVSSLIIGPFLTYTTLNIIFTSVIVFTAIPLLWIPESPYFLYSKGRITEASAVLISLRGSELLAKKEIEEFDLHANSNAHEKTKNVLVFFKDRLFLKSLALALLLSVGSQLIGFNSLQYYLQTILKSTNTSVKSEIASVVIGIVEIVAACLTTLNINKFGRRTILLWTLSGFFMGMVGLGAFFKIIEPEGYEITGFLNYLPLISVIFCNFSFSAGIGTLYWPIIAELFDGNTRAFGVSISLASINVLIFFVCRYFPVMTNSVGPVATYWFYAAMTALLIVLLAIFLPTKDVKNDHPFSL